MATMLEKSAKKTAVVLFNLGGPDSPEAVRPFLFNLFKDKAILRVPLLLRYVLAWIISARRAPIAREIYAHMGGRSPLLPMTEAQAEALEASLNTDPNIHYKTFIAMRYWHPLTDVCSKKVADYNPDDIVLLSLYPQYSTTTTGSSLAQWHKWAKKQGLNVSTTCVCCYPSHRALVRTWAKGIAHRLQSVKDKGKTRLLFSAHGLPKKIIDGGDPYEAQVQKTAAGIMHNLGTDYARVDYVVCYQSKVGPLEWLTPSTEEELHRAHADGIESVIVIPLAFVSEHSETLVELDIEYAALARDIGIAYYYRIPTPAIDEGFIRGLRDLVLGAQDCAHKERFFCPHEPCGASHKECPKNAPASVL